jgi:phage tail-like protein
MPAFRLITQDPLLNYKFTVEVRGVVMAIFTECDGLSLEREVVPYKEGGTNDFVYQFPGRVTQSKVRLRRGLGFDDGLWNWFQAGILNGRVRRTHVSIFLMNPANERMQQWDLLDAWPVKYEGPELKSEQAMAALELLEIAHHGLVYRKLTPPAS